jgi:cysteine-rich repeat protein
MRMRTLAAVLAASTLIAGNALAFVHPDYLFERQLETAQGAQGRAYRPVADRAPLALDVRAHALVDKLASSFGTVGQVWDQDTGVPLRMWGAGIAFPGSVADAQVAQTAADRVLADYLALLAPGSKATDWRVFANVLTQDVRTVVYVQYWHDMPVLGGRIQLEFKRDHLILIGSEAVPNVDAKLPTGFAPSQLAAASAGKWVGDAYGAKTTVGAQQGPYVLPIIREPQKGQPRIEYRVVTAVDVASSEPLGRWDVYVDAATGAPLARHQKLMFATGTVKYHVPVRYPGGGYNDAPAPFASHKVNGGAVTSDAAGAITWAGTAAASVVPGLAGTYAKVTSASGAAAATTLTVASGGSATWDVSGEEKAEAQIDAYINANLAKAYAFAHIDANIPWLKKAIPVFVNENQTCNAVSAGDDIHFYVSGPSQSGSITCENTGRISDVLWHEFAHSLDNNVFLGGQTEGGFQEGQADVYAQTMSNDSGLGRGFTFDDKPLRESNPPGKEYIYPQDMGEAHDSGMILSGTMWDLRAALIAQYGYEQGVAKHDHIYYGIIQHSPDMPSSYAEALAADDDNGNLADGTPSFCAINGAFAAHGLASGGGSAVTGLGTPTRDAFKISVAKASGGGNAACPPPDISSIDVSWQVRGDATKTGTLPLTLSGNEYTGQLPSQPNGTVVQYKIDVAFADGSKIAYPQNPADPMYEFYVGPVTVLKCWDFEGGSSDWTSSAKGGTNEWESGPPNGTPGNTDPAAAHGGANVFGTDLSTGGSDGLYEMSTDQIALAPVVDTTGYTNVRLQYYRWLNVEDGFFDHATIQVDGQERWANFNSNKGNNSNTAHRDGEWRFQDVDLSADAADGKVQVGFELKSDPGLSFGGWTLDDVCIVGVAANTAGSCGNGAIDTGETCDDGNLADGDGCSMSCQTEDGGGPGGGPGDQGCCSTSTGAGGPALMLFGVALMLRRRRRK